MAPMKHIEFLDETGDIMVHRIPDTGTGEFVMGTQLTVQESQVAVFFRDGRALDGFKPGRHTLKTQNLPLLGRLLGVAFGGKSPFRSYVYFVATKTFTNMGWGTPQPVIFRDTDLRMVRLRAHGAFSVRITKPRVFLNTIVGTRGVETTFDLQEFLRSIIVSRLNEALGSTLKSILDLPVHYSKIAATVKQTTEEDFGQYGIQLVDLLVEAITPPPEVQKRIDDATGVAAQDADKYRKIAAADAMTSAAENPGGPGEGMGMGMGLGMGMAMAKEIAGQMSPDGGQTPSAGDAEGKLTPDELKAKLGQLKDLLDEGLITQADFDEQKRRLLARL